MRTLSQDEIVLLAANQIRLLRLQRKCCLNSVPLPTERNISHKRAQKDANNIKSCLKVLNECGDNIPKFVSYYLDELPPVTFYNMDVCGLLRKVSRRVCALEQNAAHGGAGFDAPVSFMENAPRALLTIRMSVTRMVRRRCLKQQVTDAEERLQDPCFKQWRVLRQQLALG